MKFNKIISVIMSLVFPVYAQSDNDELLSLFKTYFGDESITELEFVDNGYDGYYNISR